MKFPLSSRRDGFTLIELLLVIGIVAILASIVLISLNPTKKLSEPRNQERKKDVSDLVNSIIQFEAEKKALPGCLATGSGGHICVQGSKCQGMNNGCNLDELVGTYIGNLPVDPLGASGNDSNYVVKTARNRVTVTAPKAEEGQVISVTK